MTRRHFASNTPRRSPGRALRRYSAAFALGVLAPAVAQAQVGPDMGGAPAPAAPAPAPNQPQVPSYPVPFGMGSPQAPNGTIGGGNATESSSHPITGDEQDTFDLVPGASGGAGGGASGGSLRGDKNGPIFGAPGAPGLVSGAPTGAPPSTHLVVRGDTLWDICGHYFENPYQWPRIWSYNPQIRNPHWIFPGDELRLKEGAAGASATAAGGGGAAGGAPGSEKAFSLTDRRRVVPAQTIFLRDLGWLQDESDEVWGDISGSDRDKMFLMDTDEVYLGIKPGHDVKLGQELSVFRPRQTAASGMIIQILGTVRVDQWSPENRVARAKVVESLDVMERGAIVGPIPRRYEVVPPRRNEAEVQAHVLASVHPVLFYGENQIVFIDKGDAAGLKPGNRLFVVRRGDAWRRSLVTPGAGYRISTDDEKPMPPMEKTPGASRSEEKYPEEVVGELRVLETKKDSSVCLMTQSKLEIEPYDVAVARKGY